MLQKAAEEFKADHEIVLAAVKQEGNALECAAEECKADRAIVLAAVKQDGAALRHAAEECKADREIVLAAVKQNGEALQCAAEQCKADHHVVWTAVEEHPGAIQHAAEELLLDSTFAIEEKEDWYILKVSMLSGRSTAVLAEDGNSSEDIVEECCSRLGMDRGGTEKLVHGTEVVAATAKVESWPGLRPKGEVSEYQLVL
eukprot:183031-Amphidinium_carterae.1